jgi:IS30 family transposase
MTKQDLEKHPEKSDSRLSPQDRENIKYLKRQGWTIPQIAKRMNRTQTEIEMVLELPDNV